jgi:hypothetical protein
MRSGCWLVEAALSRQEQMPYPGVSAVTILGWPVTATAPTIELVQQELDAYRRSARPAHLAHATRALNEALAAIREEPPSELGHVGAADEGR